jgi:hypothetical protein
MTTAYLLSILSLSLLSNKIRFFTTKITQRLSERKLSLYWHSLLSPSNHHTTARACSREDYATSQKVAGSIPDKIVKKKLHSLSARANYTDRATAACRRSDYQLCADRGCHVVSVTDLYGRILGFLDRSPLLFYQVAAQLNSRGWVDPVQDPLLFLSMVVPGIGPRPPDLYPGTLTTRPQRRSDEVVGFRKCT